MKKRIIENFIGFIILKFSNLNFEAISFGNFKESKFKSVFVSCSFVLILLGLVSFVSAGVYFSDLESKYNLGDMIELDAYVDPIVEGRLLRVELYCNDNNVITFNNLPNNEGEVNIKLPLNFFTIDQANGNCYFIGKYADEERNSMEFEISKKLLVRLSGDAFFANPGEEIIISGVAEKLNGEFIDGDVEIKIPLLSLLDLEVEDDEEVVEDEEIDDGDDEAVEDEEGESDDSEIEEVVDDEGSDEDNDDDSDGGQDEIVDEETVGTSPEGDVSPLDYDIGVYHGQIISGNFAVNVKLPDNSPAGDYRIDVVAYVESDGQRSSEGVTFGNLKIFQVLTGIDLALNDQNFDPGTSLEIRPSLLDQTGVNIDDEVSVIIRGEFGERDEFGERFFEKIVSSEETIKYDIPTNFPSGYYDIEVSNGDLINQKSFFVNKKAIVSLELINDTLVITNIGNIPYKKGVEIMLNDKPFVKIVDLEMGESTSFKLTGPSEDGYNIRVTDGNTEIVHSGVALTGRSVNVNAVGDGKFGISGPMIWIFFIVLLIVIVVFIFRNALKKKSFAFHIKGFKGFGKKKDGKGSDLVVNKPSVSGGAGVKKVDEKGNVIQNQADQVLVMKGNKSSAAVLVIKIKNKIGSNEKRSLEKAMENVYSKKGAVYEQGDFIFIIFSPIMTKKNNNEAEAAKVALSISKLLKEHNNKFRNKIEFGMGINSGQIINKVEQGKLKFTALGNFIVVAKKLAESSNEKLLLTKISFDKGGPELKGERVGNGDVVEVRRIIDGERNQKFIKGFLDREKRERDKK